MIRRNVLMVQYFYAFFAVQEFLISQGNIGESRVAGNCFPEKIKFREIYQNQIFKISEMYWKNNLKFREYIIKKNSNFREFAI